MQQPLGLSLRAYPNNGCYRVMLSEAKPLSSASNARFFASLRMTAPYDYGYSDRLLRFTLHALRLPFVCLCQQIYCMHGFNWQPSLL